MSRNFTVDIYVQTTLSESIVDSIVTTVQSHGWTYDDVLLVVCREFALGCSPALTDTVAECLGIEHATVSNRS